MAKRGVRGVAVVAVVLGMALAGCSNDTSSGAKRGGSSTTIPKVGATDFSNVKHVAAPNPCKTDPGVSGTEIKVGALVPTSGPQAISFADSLNGIKARFAMQNASGGVGSRKLVLDTADDAADPGKNATAARQLVEQDGVFGIIEVSAGAAGSAQYLYDNKIPVVGWHVGVPAWGKYPNMFGYNNTVPANPDRDYTTRNADVMKALGASKIALLGGGNQASVTFIKQIAETVKETPGMSVVYQTTDVPVGVTDFTAEVQRIKQSGADGVYTGMDIVQDAALNQAMKQAGVNPKVVIFPGGYDPRTLALPGMDGAVFGIEFVPFEENTPGSQDFKKWMGDKGIGQIPATGWLSADVFIKGLEEAGASCPTRVAFIDNLRLVKGYTANGFMSPVDYAKAFGKEFQCIYYLKVENKQFVPLFDGKEFCGKPYTFKHKL